MKSKKVKSVYVYLVPKSRWPKKVTTAVIGKHVYMDMAFGTCKVLGYEFLDAISVEVDGEEV